MFPNLKKMLEKRGLEYVVVDTNGVDSEKVLIKTVEAIEDFKRNL